MDEGINYQDHENLDEDNANQGTGPEWQMEHVSFLEREESRMLLQYHNYHLHFIKKKEPPIYRRMIPSKKIERLSFYRNFVASPFKAMRISFKIKGFIYLYIVTLFLKTIPHAYVNVFMAAYSPDQHLFLSGMSPVFQGAKFVFIMTALFELIYFSKNIILLLDYILRGVIYKNPWNRCSRKIAGTEDLEYTCYTVIELFNNTINKIVKTETINRVQFYKVDGERSILVQTEYFFKRLFHMNAMMDRSYFVIVWVMAAFMAHFTFKRLFWKLLHLLQTVVMTLFLSAYIHTSISYSRIYKQRAINNITVYKYQTPLLYSDLDALLDVTVAPPIIHILTARSLQEIFPTRDSATIVVSNSLYYLFRGLLANRLQRHCELLMNGPLPIDLNYMCWFYLWPIYLTEFYLGDLFTIFFFMLNFVVELSTFIVALQCLVEFMASEWIYFNRCYLTGASAACGIIFYIAFPTDMDYVSVIAKLTVNIIECTVIYLMYPLPRLLDDITFHFGIEPTRIRVVTLKLVFFVSTIIFYVCIVYLYEEANRIRRDIEGEYFVLFLLPVTLVMGFFYSVVHYLVQKKTAFRNLFVPYENWGPSDYHLRQLRKQFDSRYYIASQAPKNLSRYLMARGEAKCYKLDLRYDTDRRSTIATTDFRKEYEKPHM